MSHRGLYLQYGAHVAVKEPGSESSPVLLAFEAGLVDVRKC